MLLGASACITIFATGCAAPAAPKSEAVEPSAVTSSPSSTSVTPSPLPSVAETATAPTEYPPGSVAGEFFVTDKEGYTASYTYFFTGTTWTVDPTKAVPGKTDLIGKAVGTVGIQNTTPNRQNPLTPTQGQLALEVVSLYPSTAAVCSIGPRLQFKYRVSPAGPEFCGVTLANFHPKTGAFMPLAPGEFVDVDQMPATIFAKGIDEVAVDQIMKELANPTQVVVEIPGGFEARVSGGGPAESCSVSAQNAASGGWDAAGLWVIPEGQPSPC